MKLLKIASFYPSYLRNHYHRHPGLADKPYLDQKSDLDRDAFGWADFWSHALAPLGYDTMEIVSNDEPLQRAWARENVGAPKTTGNLKDIAVAQARGFRPEIVWMEDHDPALLDRIRSETDSIRLVIGWVGSAIPGTFTGRNVDLVLSCAQESVDFLRKAGARAEQLHHAFDARVGARLHAGPKKIDFSFVGQILRGSQYHSRRERLLEQIASRTHLDIFSPSAEGDLGRYLDFILGSGGYGTVRALKAIGIPDSAIQSLPLIGRACKWESPPPPPVNRRIKPFLKPAVFGMDMFQVLRDSRLTLNIHADSSPLFASNMRLFETTGVGTCLVTDWRGNLQDLFEIGKEVVAYRSADECLEKVRWLLDHPDDREAIARAGQSRTARDHTFGQRALEFDAIARKAMRERSGSA